jgi:indole-3-glycerol phosphate synthase
MADTPDILKKIVVRKLEELVDRRLDNNIYKIKEKAESAPPVRGFVDSIRAKLSDKKPAVIAEIKRASPSKGIIREDFKPAEIAKSYEAAGAACLSVLTDVGFFQGADEYLIEAREACSLPVLRKDFVLEPYQVYEARALGADCILLIAAILDLPQMRELAETATDLGMDVLVEVHNQAECVAALELGLPMLGINNRDLHSFEVSLDTTLDILPLLPSSTIAVTESGIADKEDVKLMQKNQVNTFLVGEAFMRAPDPGAELNKLFGDI